MTKEMINTNKAILVNFPASTSSSRLNNTSTTDIYIYIYIYAFSGQTT